MIEQYRRLLPTPIRLSGVKPLKAMPEEYDRECEQFERTLSGVEISVAQLRWNSKDMSGLHELTCVKESCCFKPGSYESFVKHLQMGHYTLEKLLEEADGLLDEVKSPCLFYPINPKLMLKERKACYLCKRCYLYFGSLKLLKAHSSK